MAMVVNVGSVSLLNDTLRDVNSVQEQLGTLQTQISSGNVAQTFQQLNGSVENYSSINARINSTQQYQTSNAETVSSLQTTDEAMGQMIDLVSDMTTLIQGRLNTATGQSAPFDQEMKDDLSSLATLMNTQYNGRYLFSGTASNQPTMPSTTVQPATDGVPDTSYYGGSSQSTQVGIDQGVTMEYPVRGDDPAFQQIYAAIQQSLKASDANDTSGLNASLTLLQQGSSGLIAARAKVNAATVNVQNTDDRLTQMQTYWQGLSDKVGKTDIVAASTQVASYEAILQATYQVYARLSQLRLSDYLR